MRIHSVIDEQLLAETQRLTEIPTKKGVVEAALTLLVQLKRQEAVQGWRGKLPWEENLETMRRDSGA